mmetsp:Transcript_62224/g.182434  ORF Transcript_62224/g.182434 Transcript_62224/m.182434 type:complete len:101 (-) Transcript_62224:48-350(-)
MRKAMRASLSFGRRVPAGEAALALAFGDMASSVSTAMSILDSRWTLPMILRFERFTELGVADIGDSSKEAAVEAVEAEDGEKHGGSTAATGSMTAGFGAA